MDRDHSSLTLTVPSASGSTSSATAQPFLFLVLESTAPMAASVRMALQDITEVRIGRGQERVWRRELSEGRWSLVIEVPDRFMSRQHAQLLRDGNTWIFCDSSKNGSRVNNRVIQHVTSALADRDVLEVGSTFFVFRSTLVADDDAGDRDMVDNRTSAPGLTTLIPGLELRFKQLEHVARSTLPVVIQGESGTGKELVARAIYGLSRRTGPFVALNCTAVPDNLIESELFGYRKGAFSGATEDRSGLIRAADGGTLFLDEIGEMPLPLQAKLLRVLQEREVLPLGGSRPVAVDIQLVAATNKDLAGLVEEGLFRADLLARLAGFQVDLPPLRERREDLGILIAALLPKVCPEYRDTTFETAAARTFFVRPWSLNIRELERCLGRAVVLAHGDVVRLAHLPDELLPARTNESTSDSREQTEDERQQQLVELLKKNRGNVRGVARDMNKARSQVQRWLKRYSIKATDFVDD